MKTKNLKIILYSDYPEGLPPYGGGGEVYAINLASELAKKNSVTIYSNRTNNKNTKLIDIFKFYNIDEELINKIKFKYAPYIGWKTRRRFFMEILNHLRLMPAMLQCDLFINCSDNTMHGFNNSIIKTPSLKIIHFPWGLTTNYLSKLTFIHKFTYLLKDYRLENSYNFYFANSNFTAKWTKKILGFDKVHTLYPPIKINTLYDDLISKKQNIILYTGRIIAEKKCLELAKIFKVINNDYPDWKFIIAGNFKHGDEEYLEKVKNALKGTNHQILLDVPQNKFIHIYKNSKIFWSAKGLDENAPLKMEHFGMTTVEAMANGCVPVVINKAGQAEIVNDNCGFKWNNLDELKEQTLQLIQNKELIKKLSRSAIEESHKFLIDAFMINLEKYIDKLE